MMETQNSQPPVPTRYKTVRRPNQASQSNMVQHTPLQTSHHIPAYQTTPSTNDALARSRSRYRRRPTVNVETSVAVPAIAHNAPPNIPPLPIQAQAIKATPALRDTPPLPIQIQPVKASLALPEPTASATNRSSPTSPTPNTTSHASPNAVTPSSAISGVFQPEKKINFQVGTDVLSLAVSMDTEASTLATAVSQIVPGKTISSAAILLESFKGLGLERPIRKYERVRDIVNGWEDDTKNTLVLITSLSGGEGLNASDAPTEPPSESAAWLYHCSKPGKWSKRWIVMREGSVLMAKKDTAKKEKDFQHICQLSDFDVYSPSSTTVSNTLKCPKRHCFAVKSQQKASLFQNTSDWVHYFATDDKSLALRWQGLLKGWRSYYLVQIKGYGKVGAKDSGDEQEKRSLKAERPKTSGITSPRNGSRPPTGDAANSPGRRKKFAPLISPEELAMPPPKLETLARSKSVKSGKHGGTLTKASDAPSIPQLDEEVFAPMGLLGRSYSQKVKELQDQEYEEKRRHFGPITKKNGLLSKSHKRHSSVDSAYNFDFAKLGNNFKPPSIDKIQRNKSTKPKPKPLLDFEDDQSTQTQPPPQHQLRRRANTLTANANGGSAGLIAAATSPCDAPPLPTSGPWAKTSKQRSRPPTSSKPEEDFVRRAELSGNPFTGTGLLANVGDSAGSTQFGHGVAVYNKDAMGRDGDLKPLVDLRNRTMFAEGSLLAKVEREKRTEAIVIDRSRNTDSSDSD